MRFALVVIENDTSRAALRSDRAGHRGRIARWTAAQSAAGTLIDGAAFDTEHTGPTTVRRVDDEQVVVVQRPFAGEAETLGGYLLVEVPARDDAIDLAKSWPTGETIEVRPVLPA